MGWSCTRRWLELETQKQPAPRTLPSEENPMGVPRSLQSRVRISSGNGKPRVLKDLTKVESPDPCDNERHPPLFEDCLDLSEPRRGTDSRVAEPPVRPNPLVPWPGKVWLPQRDHVEGTLCLLFLQQDSSSWACSRLGKLVGSTPPTELATASVETNHERLLPCRLCEMGSSRIHHRGACQCR